MQRNPLVPSILVAIAGLAISFGAARAEICFNAVLAGGASQTKKMVLLK
jgi:hypothetical protein